MNRRSRAVQAAVALTAVTVVGLLTGCTATPTAAPADGTTAAAVATRAFACPTLTEVAALTATPYSSRTAGVGACSYATGPGVASSSTVTVQRLAASDDRTAAALRSAAMRRGEATKDLPALAFDAFTASTAASCSAWFPASGGALAVVTARQDGTAGSKECGAASAVATLVGSGASSAGTVAVLAEGTLLGTSTTAASWPWRIGGDAGVRIDRASAAGSLSASGSASWTAAAKRIPKDTAAVVLVTGSGDAGASRLQVLRAVTAVLSAASGRASKAKLIVVGPVADGTAVDVSTLQVDLRSAATIAGAAYLDPSAAVEDASGPSTALDAVADSISAQLRTDGVARG